MLMRPYENKGVEGICLVTPSLDFLVPCIHISSKDRLLNFPVYQGIFYLGERFWSDSGRILVMIVYIYI